MKDKFLNVISITNDEIRPKVVTNDLKSLQEEVEGLIEVLDINEYTFIMNEEGKILHMRPNLWITRGEALIEILCGNILICKTDYKNGEFKSLDEKDIENLMKDKNLILWRRVKVNENRS